jgi:hypothetical protein
MNSCLSEILNTAIGRFSELEICNSNTFSSSIGSKFTYLFCDIKERDRLEKYIQILTDMSSLGENLNKKEKNI